jgi:hypothetical protein
MLFIEFKNNLRKDLKIYQHIDDIEKVLHFVPPGYIDVWYSNCMRNVRVQLEVRKKNIIYISATEIKRIISLINNAEDVFATNYFELTPDIPNYYEIKLNFTEENREEISFSAYIPKPYIDVRNALIGFVNKINIQENITNLIRFESILNKNDRSFRHQSRRLQVHRAQPLQGIR